MEGSPIRGPGLGEDRRGVFLSLDGPDGSGKSTQVEHLARWLDRHGFDPLTCRDPGGTALGERVRALLLGRHDWSISLRAEMLLYMASRAQLVDEVIRPALEAGRAVVCDRYLLANVVYQGYAGGLPVADVWEVGRAATGGLMPDVTLLIDLPTDEARARVGASRDRMEDRPDAFHEAVRRGYLRAAEDYPAPIVVIDGSGEPGDVAGRIEREVANALGQGPRP